MRSRSFMRKLTSLWKLIGAASMVDPSVRAHWDALPEGTTCSFRMLSCDEPLVLQFMKSGKSMVPVTETPEGSPQCTIQFSSKALWKQLASGNVELDTSIQDGGIVIHGPAPIMTTLVASVRESLPYRLVPMGTDDRISPTTKIRCLWYRWKPRGRHT